MKRIIISVLLLFIVLSGFFFSLYQINSATSQENIEQKKDTLGSQVTQIPPSTVPSPTSVAIEAPRRLIIPKIGVNAAVESVGLDAKGNMDVPKADQNVAWFNRGYELGEPGNTVLAGHFDTKTGAPAVFYHLESLQAGDMITVEGDGGTEYNYRVTKVVKYPYDQLPMQDVFGAYEINRLNLITCEGTYNQSTRNYSHRTVVYSEKVE